MKHLPTKKHFVGRLTMMLLAAMVTTATAWAQTWTEVGTTEALNAAIADGAHIRLNNDITLSAYLKIGQNTTQTVTINLNGHTLKRSGLSSPDANGHVFEVFGKGNLTLQNGTLSGGYANNGGGICNYGTATLDNVTIDKCNGINGGGIMNNKNATLTISGGTITGCRSVAGGAAIVNHGDANISGCTMSGNTATTRGGAIWNDRWLTVSNSTFTGNVAAVGEHDGDGGAIHLEGGTANLTDVTITYNKSKDAGAIYVVSNATLIILGNSTLSGNSSTEHGGGITNYGTVALGGKVAITGNICKTNGGGILNNGSLSMEGDIVVKGNTGDDIYLKSGKVINVMGALTGGKGSIGVCREEKWGQFTNGYTTSATAQSPFFLSGNAKGVEIVFDGEGYIQYYFTECSWDSKTKKVVHTKKTIPADAKVYNICTAMYASGGGLSDSRWFVAEGKGSTANGLTCASGERHVILCDDSEINIKNGLFVPGNATLHIYCQSYDSHMGKLNVDSSEEEYYAGIGGKNKDATGSIIIHGGNINAKGGEDAAGIGGGDEDDAGFKDITIYDGIIEATGGENAAGIGYGDDNTQEGTINIYGGTIKATGGELAAGIGGSEGGRDLVVGIFVGDIIINIYGGTIKAYGGNKGAGIGSGKYYRWYKINIHDGEISAWGGKYAAGIGSGIDSDALDLGGNSITIHNGTIKAYGGQYGAGVGGGQQSSGSTVTINGGSLYAYGGTDAAGIGSGESNNKFISGGSLTVNGGYVFADGTDWGAGIGGGEDADGADVVINGGIVEAWAGEDAGKKNGCAIGSEDGDNHRGSLKIADNMKVTAGDSPDNIERTFTSSERVPACFFRPYARIEHCYHEGADVNIVDGETHNPLNCQYCLMNGESEAHSFGDYGECKSCHLVNLAIDKDNTEIIDHWDGQTISVVLTGRTIYREGSWNTLCLPFSLDEFIGTLFTRGEIKTLSSSSFDKTTKKLTLTFSDNLNTIEAGKPYIMKWNWGNTRVNPVIKNVTIKKGTTAIETDYVKFIGTTSPVTLKASREFLFLGERDMLYHPSGTTTIGAFESYFQLSEEVTSSLTQQPHPQPLSEGRGE